MRKLSREKRAAIISALVEGSSVNSTARLVGCSKVTVLRLLADVGTLCADHHDLTVRGLSSRRIQCDEVWSFIGGKEKAKKQGALVHGDCWVHVAIDADTKLTIAYLVGSRDTATAKAFMLDVADRIDTRVQVTTDGHRPYLEAVEAAWGGEVDYAMLVKRFEAERAGEARYSPPKCTGCEKHRVSGEPDADHISTSYVERSNLTLRMRTRRFARLTNAFSRLFENHAHAVALHYWWVNFGRKHQTLKTTPAVAAGIADRAYTVLDLVDMLEREEKLLGARLTDYLPSPSK